MKSSAVNPKFDALWLVGSLFVPICFYALYRWAATNYFSDRPEAGVIFFFVIFTTIFDAPHIFATLARTHFDRSEFKRRRNLHLLSLPMALAVTLSAPVLGFEDAFLTFFGLYGSWHIIRQNIGFLKMFHRHEPPSELGGRWEIYWMYMLFAFYLTHEVHSSRDIFGNWPHPIPYNLLLLCEWLTSSALVVCAFIIFLRAYQQRRATGTLAWAKLGFLFGSGALFIWLALVGAHPLILTAVGTIAHNIQYQAWIWNYHSHHRGISKAWIALAISLFTGAIIGLGLADRYVIYGVMLPIATIYNGFVLWHYFIDGYIWRLRDAPELRSLVNQNL